MSESQPLWVYTKPGEYTACRICGVLRKEADLRTWSDGADTKRVCRDEVLCDKWHHEKSDREADHGTLGDL